MWGIFFPHPEKCSLSHLLLSVNPLVRQSWLSQSRWLLQDSASPHMMELHATRCEMPHSNLTAYQNWLTPTHLKGVYFVVVYQNKDLLFLWLFTARSIFLLLNHIGPTCFKSKKKEKRNIKAHAAHQHCVLWFMCISWKCLLGRPWKETPTLPDFYKKNIIIIASEKAESGVHSLLL